MSDPDAVFKRFVDANPVPEMVVAEESRPDVTEIITGHVIGEEARPPETSLPQRLAWAAAAACLLVLLAGGLFLAWPDREPVSQTVAEPPSPEEALANDAVSAAEEWLVALNAGDIDRVIALSGVATRTEADRRVHEWQAGFAVEGMPVEVRSCGAVSVVGPTVRVECDVRLADPVAVELGVADLVAPFDYDDGLVTWRPYAGGNISEVNDTYASYLRLFHDAEYVAKCSPTGYAPGTVIQDGGLALTGDCAQVAAPLADDIAQWIEAGMPEEQQ